MLVDSRRPRNGGAAEIADPHPVPDGFAPADRDDPAAAAVLAASPWRAWDGTPVIPATDAERADADALYARGGCRR